MGLVIAVKLHFVLESAIQLLLYRLFYNETVKAVLCYRRQFLYLLFA